ncbi:MAG: PhnD/SsuA/transferrin family substrate-binding protein [Pseudomonadota bacterium]
MRRLVALAAAGMALAGAASAAPLRIAAVGQGSGPCAPVGVGVSVGEKAYYDHLGARLQTQVLRCPVPDAKAAAAALAAGSLDMARLDPEAFAAVRSTARAILTVRPERAPNRIPVVLAVRASDSRRQLAALNGATVAFGGTTAAGLSIPRTVLAERGAGAGFYKELIAEDGEVALAELRRGRVDAAAVHAAAWQRVCRMVTPKDPEPCRDLRIVFKARPQAHEALVVRRDMPAELRYRLIGIHMPLHLEAPAAFAFATVGAPKAAEFTPAEADALAVADIK